MATKLRVQWVRELLISGPGTPLDVRQKGSVDVYDMSHCLEPYSRENFGPEKQTRTQNLFRLSHLCSWIFQDHGQWLFLLTSVFGVDIETIFYLKLANILLRILQVCISVFVLIFIFLCGRWINWGTRQSQILYTGFLISTLICCIMKSVYAIL